MAQFGLARSGLASLAFVAALATTVFSWPLQAQQTSDAAAPTLVPLPPGAAEMGPTPGYSQTPTGGAPAPAPMAEPSPLIGKQPPLPLSLPQWRRLRGNPEALSQMQSSLPPVSLTPAPEPPVAGAWQLGPQPPGTPPLSNPLLLTDGSVIAHVSCTAGGPAQLLAQVDPPLDGRTAALCHGIFEHFTRPPEIQSRMRLVSQGRSSS